MKSTDAGQRDNLGRGRRSLRDRSPGRCVLAQPEMRAIPVIVLEVGSYQSDEMVLPEDDNVLEELAPAAADPAFGHGILPRTTLSRSGRLGAQGPHESHHGGTEDRVPVEYEMPW